MLSVLLPNIPLFKTAVSSLTKQVLVFENKRFTFQQILSAASDIAYQLPSKQKIGLLCPPSDLYIKALFAVWMNQNCLVPLSVSAKPPELEYSILNSTSKTILYHEKFESIVTQIKLSTPGVKYISLNQCPETARTFSLSPEELDAGQDALMIYTSGTTSKPKGVVLSFNNIAAQTLSLQTAWRWTDTDVIYSPLPLHHVHGLINIVLTCLSSAATLELVDHFNPVLTAERFLQGGLTLFMAVPTVYVKLIQLYSTFEKSRQEAFTQSCAQMRLMVSGSAPLPTRVFHEWKRISTHDLLERYGMTEIGMALGNPYEGPRIPGSVGVPFPGVETRVESDGSLFIRGPCVSERGYWNNPSETAKCWDKDGWFETGDIVAVQDGIYQILGRASVDIIKSGGYKISALEIESVILNHESVVEAAVFGIPDDMFGECVVALVVLRDGVDPEGFGGVLQAYCHARMAKYKCPAMVRVVESIPKNAMGKVNKKELKRMME